MIFRRRRRGAGPGTTRVGRRYRLYLADAGPGTPAPAFGRRPKVHAGLDAAAVRSAAARRVPGPGPGPRPRTVAPAPADSDPAWAKGPNLN